MADSRTFPIDVTSRSGTTFHGDLVITDDWRAELGRPARGADFRVVALTRAQAVGAQHPGVAVLVPGNATARVSQAAEPAAAYAPASTTLAGPWPALDPGLLRALRAGRVVGVGGMTAEQLFGGGEPRWDDLLQHLTASVHEELRVRAAALALGVDTGEALDAHDALSAQATRALRAASPSPRLEDVWAAVGRLAAIAGPTFASSR